MVEPVTFVYDIPIWRKQRLNQWLILLFLPLPFLACTLLTPLVFAYDLSLVLVRSGIIFVGLILVLLWYQRLFFQARLERKVVLTDEALEHENVQVNSQAKVRLPYDQITQVIVHHDRNGKPFRVLLQGKPKVVEIGDLVAMEQFTTTFLSHLPETCQIEHRQNSWMDQQRYPRVLLSMMGFILLGTVILILAAQFYVDIPFLLPLVYLHVGVRFLAKRTWSRSLMTSRQREVIFASFLLVMAGFHTWIELSSFDAAALWHNPCTISKRLFSETPCEAVFPQGRTIRFLPDGQTLAREEGSAITLTTPSAWIGVWTPALRHDDNVFSFVLSGNRQVLVSLTAERFRHYTVWVWDLPTQTLLQQFHYDNVFSLDEFAVSPDGTQLAIARDDGIALVDLSTGEITATLPLEENVRALAFTPDGVKLIFTSWDLPPLVWNWTGNAEPYPLSAPEDLAVDSIETFAVSPDGRYLAAVTSLRNRLVVWDLQTGQIQQQWTYPELRFVEGLTFSPDSRLLVAGVEAVDAIQMEHEDNHLYFFSVADGELVDSFFLGRGFDYEPRVLDFSPDGQLLAVGMWSAAYILNVDRVVESTKES